MVTHPARYAQLVIAIGVAALIGWLFDIQVLKSVIPGLVTMKANTALCFVLSGTALLLLAPTPNPPGRKSAGRGLALLVSLVGILTFCEYLFGWRLGIDELLVRDDDFRIWTVAPGRMSLMTSVVFCLGGLALLGIDWSPRRLWWPAETLAVLAIILPVIALIEYFFAGNLPSLFFHATRIAVHTSAAFVLLGLGILSTRPDHGVLGAVRARIGDPLERRIYAAFLLALVTLAITCSAAFFSSRDSVARGALVEQSKELRLQLGLLLYAHQEIHSGQRGFAITGDQAFLQPYERGCAEADDSYQRLAELVQGNPMQLARLEAIGALHRKRLEHSQRVVEIRRNQGPEPALQLIQSSVGERLMEDLRTAILDMETAELRLYDQRAVDERRSLARLNWTLFASVFFAGLILVFTSAVIYREFGRRQFAETTIREQNERLEERVRERTAKLRESEARLRTVVENLSEGVAVADLDGRLLHFNRAALAMHGFTSPEEYQHILPEFADIFELRDSDGSILPVSRWPLARILKGETLHDLETRIHSLKQDWHRIFCYGGSLARDEVGQPLMAIVTMRDITKRKHAEQALMDLNATLERRVAERTRQAEEANRAKSDFLANMSHELRTPLNAIIGFSEMLKDGVFGSLEPRQQGFVTDIFDSGIHLLSLINDILDLSKVEAGAERLEALPVDLAGLLQASLMIVKEKAHKHRIRLDTRLEPALGSALADERKLKQIVFNLLSNAVKFTLEGGAVTLAARRCARAEVAIDGEWPGRMIPLPPGPDDEFLEITVEDNGVGIEGGELQKLFEPFTQVDNSITREHQGTGLGLSLVRRLAELHGGTVGVASRPGAGSRFSVWLPYRETPAAIPAERTAPEAPARPARPGAPLALVIEDDDRTAKLIEEQLRGEGFRTMRAATGEEGLVRAAKDRPQLITLDIFLPAMDGWEVMRRLKADPRLVATPVVVITISPEFDHGLALGARRVLHKPFSREELTATFAGLLPAPKTDAAPRVLVVDDNLQTVDLVATALEAEGYHVQRAYGGREAIEAARRDPPDLAILDLMMPEVSGFDVARALRESIRTADIPIIIFTAKDLTAEDHARLNGEVSAILAKSSFDRSKLIAEIRRAMAPASGAGETA
jgi:signal transduction histidine kinase/DNA-binding response OmpR family regulator/CHASE3 domain sensor protein